MEKQDTKNQISEPVAINSNNNANLHASQPNEKNPKQRAKPATVRPNYMLRLL